MMTSTNLSQGTSLRSVFAEVRLGCQDCENADIVAASIDRLLTVLEASSFDEWTYGATASPKGPEFGSGHASTGGASADAFHRSVATFVRNIGVQHLNVRQVLLQHLARLPDPLPFIEVLPALFSVAVAPGVVEQVSRVLQSMLDEDAKLLLPVIGALVDLPLPPSVAPQLARLAETAVSVAHDADLPALVRTLLKSLTILPEKHIVHSIRREARRLSEVSLALVVDAMWETLPAATHACGVFMDCLAADYGPGLGLYAEPTLVDLVVVLILLSDVGPPRARARSLLTQWLQREVFPFGQMQKIIAKSRANEVWERMIPGLWRLSVWLLTALSALTESDIATGLGQGQGQGLVNPRARRGLHALVLSIYANEVPLRETIVSSLLIRCYANCANANASAVAGKGMGRSSGSAPALADGRIRPASVSAISALLPPLGKSALHEGATRNAFGKQQQQQPSDSTGGGSGSATAVGGGLGPSRSSASLRDRAALLNIAHERRLAAMAAALLSSLVWRFPEIGASVLSSLTSRMHSSAEGRLHLPSPAVLSPLLASVAAASAASSQTEASLLITLQKALASVPAVDALLSRVLAVGAGSTSAGLDALPRSDSTVDAKDRSRDSHIAGHRVYAPKAVGLMLAGHYLRRAAIPGVPPALPFDRRAVLSWVGQCFAGHTFIGAEGDCLVYALDILASTLGTVRSDVSYHGGSGAGVTDASSAIELESGRLRSIVDACLLRLERSFQLFFRLKAGESLSGTHLPSPTPTPTPTPTRIRGDPAPEAPVPHVSGLRPKTSEAGAAPTAAEQVSRVVWNVAALAKAIVATCSHASSAAVASSTFWCVQRAASLLPAAAADSNAESGAGQRKSIDTLAAAAEGRFLITSSQYRGKSEARSPAGTSAGAGLRQAEGGEPIQPATVEVGTDQLHWDQASCDADAFLRPPKRQQQYEYADEKSAWEAHLPADIAMRLAWEHSLVAAVLLGQAQAQVLAVPRGQKACAPQAKALMAVSEIMARIHSSRRYLRAVLAIPSVPQAHQSPISAAGRRVSSRRYDSSSNSSSAGNILESSGRVRSREPQPRTAGRRGEGSDSGAGAVPPGIAGAAAWQLVVVQRLLDRCVGMLDPRLLRTALGALLGSSAEEKTDELRSELLTSAGLAVVSAFAGFILAQGADVSPEVSMSETEIFTSSSSSSSSSSFSNGPSKHPDVIPSILTSRLCTSMSTADVHVLLDDLYGPGQERERIGSAGDLSSQEEILCRLFTLIPALAARTERMRTSSRSRSSGGGDSLRNDLFSEGTHVSTDSTVYLGPALSRGGLSVLLLIALLLLEFQIRCAHTTCNGNLDDMASHALLSKVAIDMIAVNALTATDGGGGMGDHPSSPSVNSDSDDDGTIKARRMVRLFRILEDSIMPLQDSTLAVSGMKTLATLARGTKLTLRVARLSWELLGALFTVHTDLAGGSMQAQRAGRPSNKASTSAGSTADALSTDADFDIPRGLGLDQMWSHISRSNQTQPFLHFVLAELVPLGRAGKAAAGLARAAFEPAARSVFNASVNASGSALSTEMALRQFGAMWWVHEAPRSRLGGVACMLLQTLGGMYSPSSFKGRYRFPGLTEPSAELHIFTSLSLLPALLLLARPEVNIRSSAAPAGKDRGREAEKDLDPYSEIIAAAKLFVWTMRELHALSAEGHSTSLYIRMLPLTMRVCRAQLDAVESAAARAAHWRNSSAAARTMHRGVDFGSLALFKRLLQWAFAVSQWTQRHARHVQDRWLAEDGSRQLRGVSRSVPLLSLQGERTAGRLHRLARTYGITTLEEPSLHSAAWETDLWDRELRFRTSHDATMKEGMCEPAEGGWHWQQLSRDEPDAPAMTASSEAWREDTDGQGGDYGDSAFADDDVDDDAGYGSYSRSRPESPAAAATSSKHNGVTAAGQSDGYAYFATTFATSGTSNAGWGLYDASDDDDNDADNDGDEDDVDEGEEEVEVAEEEDFHEHVTGKKRARD